MAAASGLPHGDDRDSFPCAAPTPLPAPQSLGLAPSPEVVLTPERDSTRKTGSGILRQHGQGKLPRRQVRFRLGSISLDPPKPPEETQSNNSEGPQLPVTPKQQTRDGSARVDLQPPPAPLAVPVPHSTLALGAEVQAAREQGFNAQQAAEELVQRSFVTRCAVEARVSEGVNIPRDQQLYHGLVSLHVPEEELLSSVVQEKLALVRHRPEARQEAHGTGPDLLAFYNPEELFTETPYLEVEGLPPLKLQPQTRDPSTTFFMYRKLHQWDS
ncbi:protein phosphatase 1 regulatory subunit 35 [Pogona vitticeps]